MAMENAEMDRVYKDNHTKVVAATASNVAKAATIPSPIGRVGPAMDTRIMQGTANFVVPDAFNSHRS